MNNKNDPKMGVEAEKDSHRLWERDDVQFPRLLAEIKAAGLPAEVIKQVCTSMDLSSEQVHELLDRAEETFEAIKEQLDCVDTTCVHCGRRYEP